MTETILTIITLLLAAIWLVFIIVYAYKNDFSTDILSFFLPALGAILLSFFVGIKFIWIDAPKDLEPFRCTAVIISDEGDFSIYGESLPESKYSKKTINRPGLSSIVNYENHINVKYFSSINEDDYELKAKQVFDCLEYKIIEWLKEINAVQGSWYNQEYISLFPGGGVSEKADSLITSNMISSYKINEASFPNNKLFKVLPIECNLPSGGKIMSLSSSNSFVRSFIVKTKFSEIHFFIEQIGSGKVNSDAIIYNQEINRRRELDKSILLTQFSYQIEINQVCNKFNRFAKEAKFHPDWFKLVTSKFREAFSFEAISDERY